MERVPNRCYTKDFREETVKMVDDYEPHSPERDVGF
jgi:hypothetical protein